MTSSSANPIRIRQKIGKYRIERRLGEGEFAAVFRAMDTVMGSRVALKIPHPPLVDQDLLASFRRESRVVATIQHPGILHMRDATLIGNRLVIATPLGLETLLERLSRRMSLDVTLLMIDQVLSAMACAHERRVVHSAIKPENVILFADGVARLSDFGIARIARRTLVCQDQAADEAGKTERQSRRASCRSDVVSLGRMFFRMLSGQWPPAAEEWPFPGYQRLKAKVPAELITWLRKSVDPNAAGRFEDAVAMHRVFERIEKKLSGRNGRKNSGVRQRGSRNAA